MKVVIVHLMEYESVKVIYSASMIKVAIDILLLVYTIATTLHLNFLFQ